MWYISPTGWLLVIIVFISSWWSARRIPTHGSSCCDLKMSRPTRSWISSVWWLVNLHNRRVSVSAQPGAPPWSSGSVLDHILLPPVFESRRGHIWRLFRLSLRLITFGSRSAHLAYLVHKSGCKTSSSSSCPYNQQQHQAHHWLLYQHTSRLLARSCPWNSIQVIGIIGFYFVCCCREKLGLSTCIYRSSRCWRVLVLR